MHFYPKEYIFVHFFHLNIKISFIKNFCPFLNYYNVVNCPQFRIVILRSERFSFSSYLIVLLANLFEVAGVES